MDQILPQYSLRSFFFLKTVGVGFAFYEDVSFNFSVIIYPFRNGFFNNVQLIGICRRRRCFFLNFFSLCFGICFGFSFGILTALILLVFGS